MLPATGPTSMQAVKAYLQITDTADDVALQAAAGAVNALVRGLPVAETATADPSATGYGGTGYGGVYDPAAEAAWSPAVELGATMLASRLWRRKDSPAGVAAFGEFGPVYVQRNDPDVAMLLQLGDYALPTVG